MNNQFTNFILGQAMKNPQIANDPVKRHYLEVIMSGNAEEGQKIANNLCQMHGVTKEDASATAKKFFGF